MLVLENKFISVLIVLLFHIDDISVGEGQEYLLVLRLRAAGRNGDRMAKAAAEKIPQNSTGMAK